MKATVSDAIDALSNSKFVKIIKIRIDEIKQKMRENALLSDLKVYVGRMDYMKKSAVCSAGAVALAAVLAVVPVAHLDLPQEEADSDKGKYVQSADNEQWLISIGGKMVLAVDTEADAAKVFEGVKNHYLGENPSADAQVSFDKEFRWDLYDYHKAGGDPAWVMDVDSAVEYILRGTSTPKTYTIVGGDNLWDIAVKNGCSIDDLERMNPGIGKSSLPIGSVINLYEAKPFIDVTTVETVEVTENIPYETVYHDSSELYKGQTKVQTAGVNGSKTVVKKVTKVNGIEIAAEVLSEKVVTEPQKQVAMKGITPTPVYVASVNTSGTKSALAAPMSHMEVSSGFGASRGSRRHAGIDLRNPKGTPFAAAADGVVTQANYSGSYGNIVKVSHGNGLETYYAHCDAMYVTVGQTVTKGQTLGTVGRTGNATGYVLHFEVRLNGVAQNPSNYI